MLLIIILLSSCGHSNNESLDIMPMSAEFAGNEMEGKKALMKVGDVAVSDLSQAEVNTPIRKMLIKNGSIEIEVKDINNHKILVDKLLTQYKAYYIGETLNKSDFRYDFNLIIKVPADNFETFTKALSALNGGTVTRQDISASDVSEEFRDLDLRLNNKMAYLERYREILKSARTIPEILEVEEKIRVIEEEVESVKGRMKYINGQVSFSTLNLNLYQLNNSPMKPNDGFISRLWDSIVKGWDAITEFVLILFVLWPFIIIGTIIFIILYKVVRKPKKI